MSDIASTFSIVAYDPQTGELGVAVQSKYFIVGPAIPWAKIKVGAIATQASANVSYGPNGLTLLSQGFSSDQVVAKLTEADSQRERRQLGIIDAKGNTAAYTGRQCMPWAGSRQGKNYTVQGNILVSREVVESMGNTFETSTGELADRLVAALDAGQKAGGDARGVQSAALLVVREEGSGLFGYGDRYIDLRVDDHKRPIAELQRLLRLSHTYHRINRSRVLLEKGQVREAVQIAEEAVRLSPTNDIAHLELTMAYYLSGEKKASLEEFRMAVKLNPMISTYVGRMPRYIFVKDREFHPLIK